MQARVAVRVLTALTALQLSLGQLATEHAAVISSTVISLTTSIDREPV